jgi:NAD(P)-dependent dehydrogenase (short-subunit alcohol dehydrogenase family)
MLLKDKVALITGGTSGIGESTALAFAREGAKVVVSGRRQVEGEKVVAAIKAKGGTAFFVKADVSSEDDVKRLLAETEQQFKRLDIAFNNAGIETLPAPLADQTIEHFDQIVAINLRGVFLSMKFEIPLMLRTGGGSIINMSSVGGLVAFAGVGPYIATKHGVQGLTRSAALDYAKSGIRVNSVCPGSIVTPMVDRLTGGSADVNAHIANLHPMGRQGKPEEVADAVVYLASDRASFVTGQWITIDGGLTAT